MIKLAPTESQALRIIQSWQKRFRNSPTMQELADELQVSIETTRYAVNGLQRKGYIDMQCPEGSQRLLIVPLFWE